MYFMTYSYVCDDECTWIPLDLCMLRRYDIYNFDLRFVLVRQRNIAHDKYGARAYSIVKQ